MGRIILFFIAASLFQACESIDNSDIAYYKFTPEDQLKLLNYSDAQLLEFRNEDGDIRSYKVSSAVGTIKKSYQVGMGFFTSSAASYYSYDERIITLDDANTNYPAFKIEFLRWPVDEELAKTNKHVEFESELYASIRNFPGWNGDPATSQKYINIRTDADITNLDINGINYTNVLIFNSGNTAPLLNSGVPRNVNIVYYHLTFGILGFDDLDGKHWRIMN